jgi:hypothetical protein
MICDLPSGSEEKATNATHTKTIGRLEKNVQQGKEEIAKLESQLESTVQRKDLVRYE